ncbi:GNAT family N-acetyltransferase [Peribacillus frigoritolerans]|uniref:GNAT family N-acetyltransferase n=1 Tax=Peribacillus castrilensis TaxID=2897690 RepID=UPI002DC7CAD2|nr:GNAT family protein [Peribacillus castrilensis]
MLTSDNVYLRQLKLSDAENLLQLLVENKEFFEPFSPNRSSNYYSLEKQKELIKTWEQKSKENIKYQFGIFLKKNHKLLGTISLFQINRGPLQSALIGYYLDQKNNGNGYTTEAVNLVIDYAFRTLSLHRIEAGVMPNNIGSIRVLEKAGFLKEGIAKQNIKINDRWENHQVLAIINPND